VKLTACPSCGAPRPAGGRCPRCPWTPHKQTRPDLRTNASKRRHAKAVAAWVAVNGWWCPGWRVPAHPATRLTADHITPVAADGDPDGPLQVLCLSCNSRKAAST